MVVVLDRVLKVGAVEEEQTTAKAEADPSPSAPLRVQDDNVVGQAFVFPRDDDA